MRKTITRSFVETTIKGSEIKVVKGVVTPVALEDLKVMGEVKEPLKELQAKFGKDKQYAVLGTEKKELVYEISVDDFIKHAKLVVAPEETKEEVKEEVK